MTAIVPPGFAPFALVFISFVHAISGHFPKMYFFVRKEDGFELIGPLDLQGIRERARWKRPFYIK